jgi:hypothetical protein
MRFDAQQKQVAPVDYPSFENHCLAASADDAQGAEALLLMDQATFCLSRRVHFIKQARHPCNPVV